MISPAFSSRPKCPASRMCTSAPGTSLLYACAPATVNEASYFPKLREGRLIVAQPFLPGRVRLHIRLVVIKQLRLNVRLAGLIQKVKLVSPGSGFRRSGCGDVPHGDCGLPPRREKPCGTQPHATRDPARMPPRAPQRRQALLVGNRILDDDGLDLFGWTTAIRNPTGPP